MARFGLVLVPLLVAFGGCLAPADPAPVAEAPPPDGPAEARQAVERILAADMTPEARMAALEPYIDVGSTGNQVDAVLGRPHTISGHGPGFLTAEYGEFRRPGLSIGYYPDGSVYSITYGQTVLRSDDPITWPKTIDGKNAELRKKKAK
jgi:hypothetical protein